MLTTKQLGDKLGAGRSTISKWRKRGLLQARVCNDGGQWLYWPPKSIDDTHPDTRKQLEALLDEHHDAQVTHILNERGLCTGAGIPFDTISVRWLRIDAGIPSLEERLLAAGMQTASQLRAMLGVTRSTISTWCKHGLLQARVCNERGERLYWPPTTKPPLPTNPTTTTMNRSVARGAV